MSKRFAPRLSYEGNKKAKLDISVSDHNLPLSQNSNKENDFDNWGDDNDDEMLLQASQACEQAISADTSMLPDYSMWDPPDTTSTQQYQPAPSTSKTSFTFKKPSSIPPSAISTHLKNKCNTISSPLPGMANKISPDINGFANLTDDLVINAKGQDNYAYSQMLRLKEEKEKLLADIDKLQQKCVTKDGEASILRTQLKSCQMAVDSARMEKARVQDDVKREFKTKLEAYESQLANLQTQLEFKNLEIISVKEKCKNLESGKRMTQVIIPNNDISSSYRNNVSTAVPFEPSHARRALKTSSAQTEDNAPFVKLKKTYRKDDLSLVEPQVGQSYYRRPTTLSQSGALNSSSVECWLALIQSGDVDHNQACFQLFAELNRELDRIRSQGLSQLLAWEVDECHLDASAQMQIIEDAQCLQAEPLYQHEQAVLLRQLLALTAYTLETADATRPFQRFEDDTAAPLLANAIEVCELIGLTSLGVPYAGLLRSLGLFLESLAIADPARYGEAAARGAVALARASGAGGGACGAGGGASGAGGAACGGLEALRLLHARPQVLCRSHGGGLKQGRPEPCDLQVVLKQVEWSLQQLGRAPQQLGRAPQQLGRAPQLQRRQVLRMAQAAMCRLTVLFKAFGQPQEDSRCECQTMIVQGMILALRLSVVVLEEEAQRTYDRVWVREAVSRCRECVRALCAAAARGGGGGAGGAAAGGGALADACRALRGLGPDPDLQNLLNELTSTFQVTAEDAPAPFLPWEVRDVCMEE